MEMKIESASKEDGRQIYKVGKFEFQTHTEAEEFLEWVLRLLRRRKELTEAAEVWAGMQQQERGSGSPMLCDMVTGLAYLSFALAAAGAVDQLQLVMARQILASLESAAQRQAEREDFAKRLKRSNARTAQLSKEEQQPKKKSPSPGM